MDKDKIAVLEKQMKTVRKALDDVAPCSLLVAGEELEGVYEAARAHLEQLRETAGNEHLDRLELMADKSQCKWDLSPNDRAAIQWAIDTIKGANNGYTS